MPQTSLNATRSPARSRYVNVLPTSSPVLIKYLTTNRQALARAIAYLINPAFDIAELKGAHRRRDEGRAEIGDLILIRKWERLIALAMLPHSQIITIKSSPV